MKRTFQPNFDPLESRETPAALTQANVASAALPGGMLAVQFPDLDQVQELTLVGSIHLRNGLVTATGTASADIIRIDPDVSIRGENLSPINAGLVGSLQGGRIRVRVMDSSGVVRMDVLGNPLDRTFLASDMLQVEVRAWGGDDQVINTSQTPMKAYGGAGNDSLTAGPGIYGDMLHGEAGNDFLLGGPARDYLYGGPDQDSIRGEGGNDLIDGGSGDDFAYGGAGNDQIFGGPDRDWLFGEAGDDTLKGNEGNDILAGGDGNDNLYGGAGNDSLEGQGDNDGLFGGSGNDELRGGLGIDRFLRWARSGNKTTVVDRASNESLTTFKGTKQSVDKYSNPNAPLRYNPGEWSEFEIEMVDSAFAWLHAQTGNTTMLRLKNGGNLTLLRYGKYIEYDTEDGTNDAAEALANEMGGEIAATNHGNGVMDFRFAVDRETTLHELAHNWDNENPRYSDWLALSGWRKTGTPAAGEVVSADGKWAHRESAQFARSYGKTNPSEDFATMFEIYYDYKKGWLTPNEIERLRAKLDFIDQFIASLR